MMTEREFWMNHFNKNFEFLKGKRVALYGCGANAKTVLREFEDYDFVCLVDEKKAGTYMENYYIASFEQFIGLEVEYLLIATQIVSAEEVYRRIGVKCRENHIKVYNLYGKDMHILHTDMIKRQIGYPECTEADLIEKVEKHDVIAIDVDNTLFSPGHIRIFDYFQKLEWALLDAEVTIPYFAEKFLRYKEANPVHSFTMIFEQVFKDAELPEELMEKAWDIVYKVTLDDFIPRKSVMKILKYAIGAGKKVCLIDDMGDFRFPSWLWSRILESHGIVGVSCILCSCECWMDKYHGLIREITVRYPGLSYLYLGDEFEADILVPQLYGIDAYLVKSTKELYGQLEPDSIKMLHNKIVRETYEEYLLKVYNDSHYMSDIVGKRIEYKELKTDLEKKIKFCEMFEGDVCENTEIYIPKLYDEVKICTDIDAYEKLEFPVYEKPEVSIVIPVYNQFGYTYNCLKSILEHTGNVSYEVIIADDCSTDLVCELERVVSGITVLHNKDNLKFLLNCNHAAEYARGEYILFLNNDTQVQSDWLRPLVELMRTREDAGMVGSKLVYPFGCLQEAGGILWKDGSAWNYGHMKNPTEPEYNYVKEADYISGAAIMIRASLWKEIGGFDKSFAPAYYEDTDLAFEVRKHGYKVYLQPASVVVHFEGVSNGTDTATGLKSYQVVNQKKFFEKWKDVLEAEHFENGTNVYLAKDRGQTKKQILVVDHYVPNFDKDAGGRCTYMYMQAFLNLGMKVTFIGDNFAKPEPYTTVLNQLGIEVLCGDYYCMNWQEWLKDNLKHFDYVYLQRPHISVKYIDLVKEYGNAKIFYFAHDLHHVRMYRDYLVSGNEDALKESEYWKKIEMELFQKTDVGHVVGSYEQEVMQKAFPEKPIRNIPLYIYDEMPERIEKNFSIRQDILFVGGFSHAPNVDAVLWFAKEVFPGILEKYPDIVWHIVGSKAPEAVKALASKNIILEGFVTDEELGELYRKCRMVVVPLRYGAGVKGKIVEAAYYQIPVVTTTIGGEGLDASIGSFVMEDNSEKMVQLINSLYENYEELRRMSDAGKTITDKYFTAEAAKNVLLSDMDLL